MSTTTAHQDQSTSELGATAAEAGHQLQHQVSGVAQQVRQQASDQLLTQKDRLADTLDTVALLLRQSGEHAELQDKELLSQYVDKASGQVSQWSEKLRDQDVTQLLEETGNLARRQPLLFAGGALALGFLGARFLRTSTEQAQETPALPESTTSDSSTAASTAGSSEGSDPSTTGDGPSASANAYLTSDEAGSLGTASYTEDADLLDIEGGDFGTDPLSEMGDLTLEELTRPEQM